MAEERSKEILEIYKLHAELADRVSQRRLGTNRIYVSLLVGVMMFLVGLLKIGESTPQDGLVLCLIGVVGALLAVSWDRVVRSYQQLNAGKFQALLELEKKLPHPFFEREWQFLGEGQEASQYLRLTQVERSVPWVFFGIYLAVLGFGILRWVIHP